MKTALATLAFTLAMPALAMAQTAVTSGAGGSAQSVGALIANGYEIKAAVPNGAKYVVFLQKDNKAYACEFVTVSQSRCGEIK